jgi:uracil phosphoribosyltransferase
MTYRELLTRGKPGHVHVVSILASQEGLDRARMQLPQNDVTFWLGAIDDELTAQAFIVPGLGDAGDLAYGKKA